MKINNELVKIVLDAYDLDEEKLNEIFNEPVLSNPYEAKGILECGRILKKVKDEKEKILVCGDYDADGICATAILVIDVYKRQEINSANCWRLDLLIHIAIFIRTRLNILGGVIASTRVKIMPDGELIIL